MKTILASILAVAFLASTPVFAADTPAGSDKAERPRATRAPRGRQGRQEGRQEGRRRLVALLPGALDRQHPGALDRQHPGRPEWRPTLNRPTDRRRIDHLDESTLRSTAAFRATRRHARGLLRRVGCIQISKRQPTRRKKHASGRAARARREVRRARERGLGREGGEGGEGATGSEWRYRVKALQGA